MSERNTGLLYFFTTPRRKPPRGLQKKSFKNQESIPRTSLRKSLRPPSSTWPKTITSSILKSAACLIAISEYDESRNEKNPCSGLNHCPHRFQRVGAKRREGLRRPERREDHQHSK